jgi:hypothetical protein
MTGIKYSFYEEYQPILLFLFPGLTNASSVWIFLLILFYDIIFL